MKIDIFTHIGPDRYIAAVHKKYPSLAGADISRGSLDARLRTMERTPDVLQVLSIPPQAPLEPLLTPKDQVELCRIANDEMAELLLKYPDKFVAAVSYLPLKDMDAALEEAERTITQLGFKGVLIVTTLFGDQLDHPKFRPLYEMMVKYDLPIWIHPHNTPLRDNESPSPLEKAPYGLFGWPLATANGMMHLVTAGIFNDYPDIKFITHHCGGVMPCLEGRVRHLYSLRAFEPGHPANKWKDHFRKFYNDTATMGTTAALMCGYDYFGVDRLLFGTDGLTLETINSVNKMNIPDYEKEKIFFQNAVDLLGLAL